MARRRGKRRWIQAALKVRRRRKGLRASGRTRTGRHRRHFKRMRVEAAHKGLLHRYLRIPEGRKIPTYRLRQAERHFVRVARRSARGSLAHELAETYLRRVRFAINVRKFKHRRRRRG